MPYNFNDDDKVESEYQDRMPFGVNVVQLMLAEQGETEAGKDFIELNVTNKEGVEDKARVWFVGGAAPISFNTLRQIAVHSGKTDADKEKIRMAIENTTNTEELAAALNEHCIGGELWLTKAYDPSRTYTNGQGATKRSINTNVYGYEPKPVPAHLMPSDDEVTTDNIDKVFPGATTEPTNGGGNTVPDDWAK